MSFEKKKDTAADEPNNSGGTDSGVLRKKADILQGREKKQGREQKRGKGDPSHYWMAVDKSLISAGKKTQKLQKRRATWSCASAMIKQETTYSQKTAEKEEIVA